MQNSDNAWLLGVTDVMHYSIFDCTATPFQVHPRINATLDLLSTYDFSMDLDPILPPPGLVGIRSQPDTGLPLSTLIQWSEQLLPCSP